MKIYRYFYLNSKKNIFLNLTQLNYESIEQYLSYKQAYDTYDNDDKSIENFLFSNLAKNANQELVDIINFTVLAFLCVDGEVTDSEKDFYCKLLEVLPDKELL